MDCLNNCRCCERFIKATTIAVANGITTITIPETVFSVCGYWCIGLTVAIPAGTDCTRVQITDGTNTYNVETMDGNYFRPCELKCRTVLKLRYYDDPAHFVICGVKGRR